jgi:hypothetical protein
MFFFLLFSYLNSAASYILIPMDDSQKNHLKAYGIAYWSLQNGVVVQWLLNYRGGSFLIQNHAEIGNECNIRGVSAETIADVQATEILNYISRQDVNMDALKLEKPPKIAVYSPSNKLPWDDAVTLVLTYAEIPYDILYDTEILKGDLGKYDWLHLHHEDFTGQYGKFWSAYRYAPWYIDDVNKNQLIATSLGFKKVSRLKLAVVKTIRDYVANGGFMFAMCSASDSYDIALSAEGVDICDVMFDGDPPDPDMQNKIDYNRTFAFKDYKLERNPSVYAISNIDVTHSRKVTRDQDFFTLFEFSAKWDPVPTMLCQDHSNLIKGFMGQTTAFNKNFVKSNVLIMGENKAANEAKYIHGEYGKGTWTFYGGHDPEDYQHLVYAPPTDLNLFPNSAGYRLILNNVLFPAAKKKKLKT